MASLSAFKTTALSRLAAQHQEITALRAAISSRANVRTLPGAQVSGRPAVMLRDGQGGEIC